MTRIGIGHDVLTLTLGRDGYIWTCSANPSLANLLTAESDDRLMHASSANKEFEMAELMAKRYNGDVLSSPPPPQPLLEGARY